MAQVKNSTVPVDLQDGFNKIVQLTSAASSNTKNASVQRGARTPQGATKAPTERAAAAQEAASWLATQWVGPYGTAGWSDFYAARFNEVMGKRLEAPYWRSLDPTWDRTGISTPSIGPFTGTVNPAYDDPLRQPTECQYQRYDRLYTTPTYPSYGSDKSPGWAGAVDSGYFKDTWHATRIIAFTIPTPQQSATRRPLILHVVSTISATATIRGNTIWFAIGTRARIAYSGWTPTVEDSPITHYKPSWKFTGTIPGNSPGGWVHDETLDVWRYGSWKTLNTQQTTGQIVVVEIGTPPSCGRYYARNDSITVLHDDTATMWWPQKPGEM